MKLGIIHKGGFPGHNRYQTFQTKVKTSCRKLMFLFHLGSVVFAVKYTME